MSTTKNNNITGQPSTKYRRTILPTSSISEGTDTIDNRLDKMTTIKNSSYCLSVALMLPLLLLSLCSRSGGFVLVNNQNSRVGPSTSSSLFADVAASDLSTTSSTGYSLDGEEIRGPITPLRNFILVKVKDTLTATEGGILLPDQSKERPTEGLVVASGPGKIHPFTAKRIHNPIKPGMSVLYGKFDGKALEYNEDQCQMIRDDDCLLAYEGVTMKLDNVFPVRDYVLIALDENPETLATSSGVVIANQVVADDVPCEGVVVKVGEGRMASNAELTECPVKVGETVKFKDYAGNDITIEGKPYSVVKMVNILSSFNEERVKELREGGSNDDDVAP